MTEADIDYESDGSHKHDSCMQPSDDEELNFAQSEQQQIKQTNQKKSTFSKEAIADKNTKKTTTS